MLALRSVIRAASAFLAGVAGSAATARRAAAQVPDALPPYLRPPELGGASNAVTPSLDDAPLAVMHAGAVRDSLVRMARAQVGRRYRYGGTRPETGFDCSGLVRYVMAALRIDVPRTARRQAESGRTGDLPRDASRLRPGDLLTFGAGSRASHVGIYVGDGRFVHASTKAGRVIESTLENGRSSLVRRWRGARRFVVTGDTMVVRVATGA